MEKAYHHQKVEEKIYRMWESGGYFTPKIDPKKKPFTILLPLPNANDPLHMGHALFTVEDIMIRYHRMLGDPTLWLPGGDHAGIETQFVFEKKLAKKGKSRFDFDRQTLYQLITDFVKKNKEINKKQLKRMGFSLDWTRYHYSLEPKIIAQVFATFRKLRHDGLVYRDEKMVNYCPKCGTAFSDLEIKYQERKDPLYYIKYGPTKQPKTFITVATTRPETMFGDTALAVHPKDKKYIDLIDQKIIHPLLNKEIPIVADRSVDPKFGTGVVKVTPAHDPNDFEIGKRHHLPMIKVIDFNGKLNQRTGQFAGLTILAARKKVVAELKKKGNLIKIDKNYLHRVAHCYRCQTTIEPMLLPQWFVKTKPLAKPAIKAVKEGKTKIVPKNRFEKMYFDWLKNIHDWNFSRQIVWGPRLPAWYCLDCNQEIVINFIDKNQKKISGRYQHLKKKYRFLEIKKGLQQLTAPKSASYSLDDQPCKKCGGENILQETDTFDTWFLSSQWPLTTLGFQLEDSKSRNMQHATRHTLTDFQYFYPTSVLDTLWDILFFWVARMMMFGLYLTKEVPFKIIHLHARVVDQYGQKMSKSKGNVINPMAIIEKYGADALRMALIFGVAPAADVVISEEKLIGMRNFANKIWNISRFVLMHKAKLKAQSSKLKATSKNSKLSKEDKSILSDLNSLIKNVTKSLEKFRFSDAAQNIYHFLWHRFADEYVEYTKTRLNNKKTKQANKITSYQDNKNRESAQTALAILNHVYLTCLKLLHPFMPFITEEIWQRLTDGKEKPLIISSWPKIQPT